MCFSSWCNTRWYFYQQNLLHLHLQTLMGIMLVLLKLNKCMKCIKCMKLWETLLRKRNKMYGMQEHTSSETSALSWFVRNDFLLFMFTWDAKSLKNAFLVAGCVYPGMTSSSRIRINHANLLLCRRKLLLLTQITTYGC